MGHNEIDETVLCSTLFRNVCGDSSLLMSTVFSLPYEVSTEALISDLELTRVSVDRFTAETTNLAVGRSLIGSVSQGYLNPCSTYSFKNVIPFSHPSPGLPDLEQPRAASPRPRLLLCRPSAGSVLSPGQSRLVHHSDAGASSGSLPAGPHCTRLIRVGFNPPHAAMYSMLLISRLTIRQFRDQTPLWNE